MKPLLILTRIIFVGIFWSIFFLEGIRVIMLQNWRFDIFRSHHWQLAWDLWLSGWVIDDPKEWAFVLIILTFIPLWLTGWAALSMLRWGKLIMDIILLPLRIFNKIFDTPVKIITNAASVKVVKKKKSYKEIRPRSLRPPVDEKLYNNPTPQTSNTSSKMQPQKPTFAPAKEEKPSTFDHSLFQFDDEDSDFDLNFDNLTSNIPEPALVEKPAPQGPAEQSSSPKKNKKNKKNGNQIAPNNNAPQQAPLPNQAPRGNNSNSTLDIIKQKGYEVITGATIKNTLIDFIGVSEKQICICMIDKEPGDWLADEERFNDEEPLWFSESSHRISPVRKLDIARLVLNEKLKDADINLQIDAYIVVQIGNIINAEDMFDIWSEMDISVTRIDRGTPKELKLFAKTLDEASSKIDSEKFEKVKKLIRSIA